MTQYLDKEGLDVLATQIQKNFVATKQDTNVDKGVTTTYAASSGEANEGTTINGDEVKVGDPDSFTIIDKDGVSIKDIDQNSVDISSTEIGINEGGGSYTKLVQGGIKNSSGSAKEVFTTNGGTIAIGYSANNLVALNDKGKIPTAVLNLSDTTIFKVVTQLPTDIRDIEKCIYVCPRGHSGLTSDTTAAESGTPNINKYTEWLYTGEVGSGQTYLESNWEKLGEHDFNKIDLSNYYTKTEADARYNKFQNILFTKDESVNGTYLHMTLAEDQYGHGAIIEANIPNATTSVPGLMSEKDKARLEAISTILASDIETLFSTKK